MGKSKSIADLQTQNAEAKEFLNRLAEDAEKEYEFGKGEIEKLKQQKYGTSNDDSVSIVFTYRADSTVMSEWSLSNVKKIIDSTSAAFFGKKPDDAVPVTIPAGLEAMANLQVYIASKALELISGILDSFVSANTAKANRNSNYQDVSPGVTLFVWISEMTYESKQFFTNDLVAQNVYVFEARFSAKDALTYSKVLDAQLYESEKIAWRTRISDATKKVADPNTSDDELTKITAKIQTYQNNLDGITDEIRKLDVAQKASANQTLEKIAAIRKSRS